MKIISARLTSTGEALHGRPAQSNVAAPSPVTGLGDLVAKVAQPIAGVIDAMAGTHLKTCGACAKRKAALNRMVPDIKKPL